MSGMSVRGQITTDIYRQMMDLQEKLRQSEAERIRLEEMFTVLVKTFREEEEMRLKNLENRYHTFLEDCARRSYRNEKILRSVERVESGANALHAKTERLKLLRSHYEAYLGRVIPSWRQPALLRYGPSPLPSTQEMDWIRRNQLIPQESVETNNPNYFSSRLGRPLTSNPIIPSEYFPNRLSDGEKHIKSFQSDRNHPDKNYLNCIRGETEGKGYLYDYDKNFEGNIGFRQSDPRSKPLSSRFEDKYVDDETSAVKGLESALHRKLTFGNRPDLSKNALFQQSIYRESPEIVSPKAWDGVGKPDQDLNKQMKARGSPVHREEHWFSERRNEASPLGDGDKRYISNTPRMTREPLEIKKPEIIVGKIHPEASLKVDYFNNGSNFVGSSAENTKSVKLFKPINESASGKNDRIVESESLRPETDVRQSSPQAKWSLLKHRRTIDKLKETLSFEEAQESNATDKNIQNEHVEKGQKSLEHSGKEGDETDVSQSLSEGWPPNGEQLMSSRLVVQASDKEIRQQNSMEPLRTDETNGQFGPSNQELPQKDINDANEEVYEDNEEAYPESYYEQPPKSDYSRDIVSNVILEEDENEVNVQDELPEGSVQNQESAQENIGYEQSQYHPGQEGNIQTDYNGYSVEGTGEMKENEYQNYQSSELGQVYKNEDGYQADYTNMEPQEGYTYDNQEGDNYNVNNGMEYNAMEQYSGNAEAQQYYESQQSEEHGNYGAEGMGQGENFDNAYGQMQNYENSSVEQYNEGDGTYQQEYNQGQDGNYYGQGEYDGYYQAEQEQNEEYPRTNEGENTGYPESPAYGNVQGDDGTYAAGSNNLPLRQSNLSHLLESDSESFQMEHGSAAGNEDSDFDFSMSQQQ